MKNNHYRVLKRFGVAVVALGFLGINHTLAEANTAPDIGGSPKEGVSVEELNNLVQNFEVNKDGLNISFAGLIPTRCVDSNTSMRYQGASGGKHVLMVRLSADCEANPKFVSGEPTIALSRVFPAIPLLDVSGNLTLRHLQAGDPSSRNRVADEPLLDGSKRSVSIMSSADRAAKDRADSITALARSVDRSCKAGDFVGVGTEIQNASDLLGDVSDLLDKVNLAQQQHYKDLLSDAKSPTEAKEILARYKQSASDNGWDDSALNDAYIDQRFALLDQMATDMKVDKDITQASVDKAIESWRLELLKMDRPTYRKNIGKFVTVYSSVAMVLAGKKNYVAAAQEYEKAKEFTESAKVKQELDQNIARADVAAYKACLDKDVTKAASCDKDLKSKAMAAAKELRGDLADSLSGSEDAAQQLNDYDSQYAQTFGAGPSAFYAGYGASNPYAPGLLEQYKYQQIQQYYQNQQQQMMMGGAGMNRSPTSSNFLF